MFKIHTDGFASQYTQDVFNVGIQQFFDFDNVNFKYFYSFASGFTRPQLGEYVVVARWVDSAEHESALVLDYFGNLFACFDFAASRSMDPYYDYEIWQLCDDGELWQGWELSCLSVEHVETSVVPYADREQGAWAYGLLRAEWYACDAHGDCYALILNDGAVFARNNWQSYALDSLDDACECFSHILNDRWSCLGFVDWHSCEVDPRTNLYVWESQVIDWMRLFGLEITWDDDKLRDERVARIESTAELVA